MAQFRGTIEGARGGASRLGHKSGGITVTANGWDDGVKVYADHRDGRDHFTVIRTGGSHGGAEAVVAEWDEGGPIAVPDLDATGRDPRFYRRGDEA